MFQRILTPLDGSEFAEKSLPYAESLAQAYGAEVVMGWVVQLRTYAVSDFQPIDYGMAALMDTSAEKERATTYLQRLRNKLEQRQIRASYRIVESYSIADAIVAMAVESRADIIVKTTYARLGPSRWLWGNVAALVMQRAPCPLFLVRVSGDEGDSEMIDTKLTPLEISEAAFLVVNLVMEAAGWRVGGPNAAERFTMLTVMFTGNLAAALVGGGAMGWLLSTKSTVR